MSIKKFMAAGAFAGLAFGACAETEWKPPTEIAPKSEAAAPATPAAPVQKAEKKKSCAEQAAEKGLKGKAKKQFVSDCAKS